MEGEVKLAMPEEDLGSEPAQLARDPALVARLETAMEGWARTISATVDEQLQCQPQGKGPLAEVEFWKERCTALSALYEQIRSDGVQTVLTVMKLAGVASFSNFEYHRGELTRYYLEARDNVKFLGTLERHFKNITHGANFSIVVDTIPATLNSLRMVWVISRHYNTDERMVPLMGRIAWELCERASRVVNVRTIFKCVHVHAGTLCMSSPVCIHTCAHTRTHARTHTHTQTKHMCTACMHAHTHARTHTQCVHFFP